MPAAISTLDDPHDTDGDPVAQKLKRQIGGYSKNGNREAADDTRRQLAEHQLAKHIKRVVDGAPPLTTAQRDRLALLLRPGSGGGHAA